MIAFFWVLGAGVAVIIASDYAAYRAQRGVFDAPQPYRDRNVIQLAEWRAKRQAMPRYRASVRVYH